jgi:hypothetical protein
MQVGRVNGVFLRSKEGDKTAVSNDEDIEKVQVLQRRDFVVSERFSESSPFSNSFRPANLEKKEETLERKANAP